MIVKHAVIDTPGQIKPPRKQQPILCRRPLGPLPALHLVAYPLEPADLLGCPLVGVPERQERRELPRLLVVVERRGQQSMSQLSSLPTVRFGGFGGGATSRHGGIRPFGSGSSSTSAPSRPLSRSQRANTSRRPARIIESRNSR